jgi:hypothetical protein
MTSPQTELQLSVAQALVLLIKVVREIRQAVDRYTIGASVPEAAVAPASRVAGERNAKTDWTPVRISLDDVLTEASNDGTDALREKQRQMINSLDLSR